jgi:hypothetical protein
VGAFDGEHTGTCGNVANEGDIANALVGSGVLHVKSNGQRTGLLGILFDEASTLQDLNVIGDRRGGFQTNVLTNLSDRRREVSLTLARDNEFENLTSHGSKYIGHGTPFYYEQLFVG